MLILSRKCNEQIVIGEGIIITVVSIRGGSVRLGIEAPPRVSVHRQEVYRAIQEGRPNPKLVQDPLPSPGKPPGQNNPS